MVQNLWAESETPVQRRFSPNFPRPFSASRIFEPSNLLKIGWKVATVATVVAWEKAFGLKRLRGWFGLIWGELVAASKVPSFLWRIAACGWSRQKGNLVMQTHLTVMRSVTFDTTTSLCVPWPPSNWCHLSFSLSSSFRQVHTLSLSIWGASSISR